MKARNRQPLTSTSFPNYLAPLLLLVRPVRTRSGIQQDGDNVQVDEGLGLLNRLGGEVGEGAEVSDAVDRREEVVAPAVGWGGGRISATRPRRRRMAYEGSVRELAPAGCCARVPTLL
jgi:hypothetical protein